ncbi:MAG: 30S ribosomal protein S21 [Candidatus Levybacteria bacterium GW2011_GWA2_40_16]|nr:MAG: 30S ribosomal protein S21 [Candidatus Levybacteria bacterium GW2011_GWA2_40_16]
MLYVHAAEFSLRWALETLNSFHSLSVSKGGALFTTTMVFVKAKKGESSDALIRKFIRKISEEQLMQKIKDRQFYRSPSEIKKEKRKRRRGRR